MATMGEVGFFATAAGFVAGAFFVSGMAESSSSSSVSLGGSLGGQGCLQGGCL